MSDFRASDNLISAVEKRIEYLKGVKLQYISDSDQLKNTIWRIAYENLINQFNARQSELEDLLRFLKEEPCINYKLIPKS